MAKVNATRMELLKLKKRVKLAKKGHKLMKEKRDALMKEFLKLVQESGTLREQVNKKLRESFEHLVVARALTSDKYIKMLFLSSCWIATSINMNVRQKNVMNVKIPLFDIQKIVLPEGDFSFLNVSTEVEVARASFKSILGDIIRLAELEKAILLLSKEVETARRRVNALEYVLIPQFEGDRKRIAMKLEEMERGQFSILLKVKSNIQEKERIAAQSN